MEASWNRGTPKSSIEMGFSIINQGSPMHGKHHILLWLRFLLLTYSLRCGFTYTWVTCSSSLSGHPSSSLNVHWAATASSNTRLRIIQVIRKDPKQATGRANRHWTKYNMINSRSKARRLGDIAPQVFMKSASDLDLNAARTWNAQFQTSQQNFSIYLNHSKSTSLFASFVRRSWEQCFSMFAGKKGVKGAQKRLSKQPFSKASNHGTGTTFLALRKSGIEGPGLLGLPICWRPSILLRW